MKTAKEREDAFRKEFDELLKRHGAEFEVTDDGKPWGMHSGIAVVSMYGTWDSEGNPTAEYAEFEIR